MSDDVTKNSDDQGNRDVQEALGQSDAFLDFQERLSKVATVDRPVLIIGERGTGKELAAARLHYLSKRWQGPFIALNCSALSPTLMEAELFGHEAGAFTGAGARRTGRFEAADGGTLMLDEIGTIPREVQEKILRTVEYGTFERVGSSRAVEVNARIVGATNADLRVLVREGKFMPDLLDRLSFDVLVVPPLRERVDDVPLLANHFAARMAFELEWEAMPEITEPAMDALVEFSWPGNVRELKNVIERAVYRSHDTIIDRDELIFDPFEMYGAAPTQRPQPAGEASATVEATAPPTALANPETVQFDAPLQDQVRDLELRLLKRALEDAKFNQRKAADILGLSYHQFRGLYRKYQDDISE